MAIQPCKECGGPLSDKAESCPRCGVANKQKYSHLLNISLWIVICSTLILIFYGAFFYKTKPISAVQGQDLTNSETVINKQVEEKPTSNWVYRTDKDEMRDTVRYFAGIESLNKAEFEFPYNGGSKLFLTLRHSVNGTDVMLMIEKGQILCSLRNCEVAFKFDNEEVENITMSEPDNYSSSTLFVTYDKTEDKIIQQLKGSKKLIVEVPFYQEGRKQFIFDVSGLNWKH